ncbi:unnamed protein product [Somion occarium]|uniref:F-box domain-containing protein n=1 Tax=Somion occarium TaxID=3059160 RepID=A0ABP1DL46_9APHY
MSSPRTSTNPESNASPRAVGPRKHPAEDPADEEEPSKHPRSADADFSDDVKPERRAGGSLSLTPQILNPLKRSADDAETEPPNPGDIDNRAMEKIRLEVETNPTVEQQKLSGDASSSIETLHKRPLAHKSSPDLGDGRPPAKRIRVKGAKRSRKPQKQRDDALLLPVELHHEILELMWEDGSFEDDRRELVGTLRACARTCSRWRSAARPFIFRFVMIRRPSRPHSRRSTDCGMDTESPIRRNIYSQ